MHIIPKNLMSAVQVFDIEGVRTLLEKGHDPNNSNEFGDTPLHLTAERNYLEIARLLLEHGADVNARNNNGFTPPHNACFMGNIDLVRLFVNYYANINIVTEYNDTPLHIAVFHGYIDLVRLLLEQGADVEVRDDRGDRTPLDIAIDNSIDGREEILNLFQIFAPEAYFDKFCTTSTPGGL